MYHTYTQKSTQITILYTFFTIKTWYAFCIINIHAKVFFTKPLHNIALYSYMYAAILIIREKIKGNIMYTLRIKYPEVMHGDERFTGVHDLNVVYKTKDEADRARLRTLAKKQFSHCEITIIDYKD